MANANLIRVTGPDGAVHTFPAGTTAGAIQKTLEQHYGRSREQRRAVSEAAMSIRSRQPSLTHRSVWERFTDRVENSLEGSYGALARWMVSPRDMSDRVNTFDVRDPETGQVIQRRTETGAQRRAIRESIASTERQRRADLEERTRGDEWYRAPGGLPGRAAAASATLSGELAGAALDPTSWIGWGRTLVTRIGVGVGTNAAFDLTSQAADIDLGVAEHVDTNRTILAAAVGGALPLLPSAVRKTKETLQSAVLRLLRQPEADARVDLEIGDEINAPALTEAEIDLTLPTRVVSVRPDASASPPRPARTRRRPSEAGAAEHTDWSSVDWSSRPDRVRAEAAVRHLDSLKRWIKPDQVQAFIKALDEGLPADESASRINERWIDWERMGDPREVLGMTAALGDIFRQTYEEAGVGAKGWEAAARVAKQLDLTLADLIRTHADVTGEGGIAVRTAALRDAALASDRAFVEQAKELRAALAQGDHSGVPALAEALNRTVVLGAMDAGASSEIARALQYRQRTTDLVRGDLQGALGELGSVLNRGESLDLDALDKVLTTLTDAYENGGSTGLRQSIAKMREIGFWDYAGYAMTANLLSAPTTHLRNAIGTPIHALFQIAERYTAAGVGAARASVGLGSRERVTFREANAYVAGAFQSAGEALTLARDAFVRGAPVIESRSSIMSEEAASQVPFAFSTPRAMEWAKRPFAPRTWADAMGVGYFELVRTLGFRPSVFADEFYKTLSRRAELNALSYREAAYRSALAEPEAADEVFTKTLAALQDQPTAAAFRQAKAHFAETPSGGVFAVGSLDEEMALVLRSIDHRQMALDHARLMTFQDAGPIVEKWDQALKAVPLVKHLWVNFVRTPVSLLRAGLVTRNPIVGGVVSALELTTAKGREKHGALFEALTSEESALARGGAEADLVLARQAVGAATLGIIWLLWAGGNLVGKQTEQQRRSGIDDYSVRLPDGRWVQFTGMSPLGEMLGLVADTASAVREHDLEDDGMAAIIGALAAAVRNNVVNKSFLSGLSDFMDMVTGGQHPAATDEASGDTLVTEVGRALAPRVMPGGSFLRRLAQDQDPVIRDARSFTDMILSGVPKLSESLPARRDFMGRPLVRPEGKRGLLQAFNVSEPQTDPLERELAALATQLGGAFQIGMPPRTLNGEELSPTEYSRLLEVQGQLYRMRGLNMEGALRELIADPAYQAQPYPEMRAHDIKTIVTRYRERANSAVRRPGSEFYMREAASRTGSERLRKESRRRGWSDDEALRRAINFGIDPGSPEVGELRDFLIDDSLEAVD